jgi:hypothetical protein
LTSISRECQAEATVVQNAKTVHDERFEQREEQTTALNNQDDHQRHDLTMASKVVVTLEASEQPNKMGKTNKITGVSDGITPRTI